VFWNCYGYKLGLAQPATARNYSFGFSGKGSREKPVAPRSLYLQQLEERMGKAGVENITTDAQRRAVTDPTGALSRVKLIRDPITSGIGERSGAK
jgi:hypothetical protein